MNQQKVAKQKLPIEINFSIKDSAKFPVIFRVRQLAYVAYVRTPTFISVHMILDMPTLTPALTFSL